MAVFRDFYQINVWLLPTTSGYPDFLFLSVVFIFEVNLYETRLGVFVAIVG